MKKIICVIMAIVLICACSLPCFAVGLEDENLFTYTFPDGTVVEYYMDEGGHPYNYRDGEKVFVNLPLEQFVVTDKTIIDEVKRVALQSQNSNFRSEPTTYEDISNIQGNLQSPSYTRFVSFDNYQTFTTPWIKISARHAVLHFRTDNVQSTSIFNKKVSFVLRWYYIDMDVVTQETYNDIDCRSVAGQPFGYLTQQRYCQFALLIPDYVTSYTAVIWTTAG